MAETQVAAPTIGQAVTAPPAPVTGPTPAATDGSEGKPFDWGAEHDAMSDAFGRPNDTTDFDLPPRSKSASAPAPSSPADDRQAGGAKVTETSPAGKEGTPGAEPVPGDDLIADFAQFEDETPKEGEAGKQVETLLDPLDTDEKIAKAIDPDGKQTDKQKLANAQSLIGKHGRAFGEAKKLLRAYTDANTEILQHYETFQTAQGQKASRLRLPSLIQQSQLHPFEQVNDAIQKATGYKLVPKDWNGEGNDELRDFEEVSKQLIPEADLDLKERLAQIGQDPVLKARFDREIQRRDANRIIQARESQATQAMQRQAEQQQAQREVAEADAFYKGKFEELKKLAYYPEIKNVLVRWLDTMNENAPEMPRDMRWKIALGQSQLTRVRKVTRAYGDLRATHEREALAKSMALGSVEHPAQGMFAESPEEGDKDRAEQSRKAAASRAELAKVFA